MHARGAVQRGAAMSGDHAGDALHSDAPTLSSAAEECAPDLAQLSRGAGSEAALAPLPHDPRPYSAARPLITDAQGSAWQPF